MKSTWKLMTVLLAFALLFSVAALSGCSCGHEDDDDDHDDDDEHDDDHDDDDDSVDDDDMSDDDDDADSGYVTRPVYNESPPWPEWCLRHWVWEDESTQESALDIIAGYIANDIPVAAIIIDSPWATGYNTFEWDLSKYPEPQDMIDDMHDDNVRIFLWTTPNVNLDSPNFQEGFDNGYYVQDGQTLEWWKGPGAYIDFWNPDALAWWHDQVDNVLDMGIDGWKTDGSEFSMWLWGSIKTAAGPVTVKEYQEMYYRDFFEYTRAKLGNDRVITARPVDSYGIPFWGPTFASPETNFAGWVGDQDPDWGGLNNALVNMYLSAQANYVNFGSDIGGYRGDDIREKDLFIRWAQFGALSPIMENGGSGEHRPWIYDTETLDIYRDFTYLHHALVPYLYSQGADSYREGVSLMRFWHGSNKKSYQLGRDLFVRPIVEPGNFYKVFFPAGEWIHWFTGTEYAGNTLHWVETPIDEYPLFVRKGAILPMDIREGGAFVPHDPQQLAGPITVTMFPKAGTTAEFDFYEEKGTGARIEANYKNSSVTIRLSPTERPFAFRVVGANKPNTVTVQPWGALEKTADLLALVDADSGWTYENGDLWVKPGSAERGLIIQVQ
jgi:alpha-glucosidase (family GH31 glycosyl hydrolase)